VFAIFAELALDQCDRAVAGVASQPMAVSSGAHNQQDPCADGCVPDCFCCCQGTTPEQTVLPAALAAVAAAPSLNPPVGPRGVRPVLYRPPLKLA